MLLVKCKLKGKPEEFLRIDEAIRTFQFVQNKCLRLWMDSLKGSGFNKYTGNYYCVALKKEFEFVSKLNSQSCQDAAERAWQQISRFYKRLKNNTKPVGYPKFKRNARSLEYKQIGWKLLFDKKLKLSNIGIFKLYGIEELLKHGTAKIQRLIIIKKADGYYAHFVLNVDRSNPQVPTGKTLGLDLGLNHFYTDSNGESVDCPKFYRKAEKQLNRLQRGKDKKKKGSNNRKKAINKLARKHLDVSRQRKDFVTKLARCVVKSNDFVAIENLNVKGMKQYRGLSKSISDAGWYTFRLWLEYYAKVFGRVVQVVNPAYTSQDCSGCGNRVKKSLSERTHTCTDCGLVMDRDHNAAINILKKGLSTAGQAGIKACGELSSTSEGVSLLEQDASLKQESYSFVSKN